ncbi:arrestin domain-containing protein 2-like isoform X2 [Sitodiplosis mosellana]|uniref:arrestin domain-containing protein 2-like isoform X2 n=1 Tax=Sitodiplosis mosellana TaxID=263140 RepID=UPI0024444EF1|nr:arrestin domain-containing protein 2-like isoform X2 [Sitodiplosis mosellana]
MPTTCKINFENNPQKIFLSGQKLHITVRLKLTEEVKVRGVYIHLRGMTHARFIMDDFRRAGHYATDEDVLDMKKCLVDGNGENQVLPVGTHDYSFACTLPNDLPSSFTSNLGYIKYSANVVLRIPFWPDKKFEEKFTVFKTVNLNDYPSLRYKILFIYQDEVSSQKTERSWLIGGGQYYSPGIISISGRIPAGGYTHGQLINVQVSVSNETFYPIQYFLLYILRQTTYHHMSTYSENQRTKLNIVQKRTMANWKCEQNKYKSFPAESIQVPAMIPPTNETSKIIKTRYLVSIRAMFNTRCGCIGMLDLPITIGTIPFGGSTSTMITSPQTRTVSSAPSIAIAHDISPSESLASAFPDDDTVSIRTYTSTPPPFPDDDFDLPTYEDALLMDEEIDLNLQSIGDSFAQLHVKSTKK